MNLPERRTDSCPHGSTSAARSCPAWSTRWPFTSCRAILCANDLRTPSAPCPRPAPPSTPSGVGDHVPSARTVAGIFLAPTHVPKAQVHGATGLESNRTSHVREMRRIRPSSHPVHVPENLRAWKTIGRALFLPKWATSVTLALDRSVASVTLSDQSAPWPCDERVGLRGGCTRNPDMSCSHDSATPRVWHSSACGWTGASEKMRPLTE
jgi:hypothetical protein